MWTRVIPCCTLSVCWTLWCCSSAWADAPVPEAETTGRAAVENTIGYALSDPFGPLIRVRGSSGEGLGYQDNYYSLNAFIPKHIEPGQSLFFLALLGSVTDVGTGIGTVGAGYRHYVPRLNRIFSASGWFDLDGGHASTYSQAGVSLESLGKNLDFRINGYYVVGDDFTKVSDTIMGEPFFGGNRILLHRQLVTETAYSGGEFEVGGPLPFLGRHGLNAYVGAYHLISDDHENTTGVKVRAEALVHEDLSVSVSYSDDDVFGANTWLNVVLTLPDGRPARWFKPRPVRERLSAPIERSYRVHVNRKIELLNAPAVNPIDGKAFTIVHVDPNRTSPGDGSFEKPFSDLALFENAPEIDIIRVSPRSDDTATNLTLTSTLGLFDNQRLLSTALPHTFTATKGTFALPGFTPSTTGVGPIIMNVATDEMSVVNVRSNSEISGFVLDGNGIHDGITGSELVGFNFNNNIIGNGRNGVVLDDATGTVAADRPGIFQDNIVRVNTGDGFRLENIKDGTLDLSFTGNLLTDNGPTSSLENAGPVTGATAPPAMGGAGASISTAGIINANDPDADLPLGILNNTVRGNGTGMELTALTRGTIKATVEGNFFDDNTDVETGFRATADGGHVILERVRNNSFSGNSFTGFSVAAINDGELALLDFTFNDVLNNGHHGITALVDGPKSSLSMALGHLVDGDEFLFPTNAITGNGLLTGDDVEDAGKAGILVTLANQGTADVSIISNNLNDNGNGVLVNTGTNPTGITDSGALDLEIRGNTITRAVDGAGAGIVFDTKGANITATIAFNEISGDFGFGLSDPNDPASPLVPKAPDLGPGIMGTFRDGTFDLTIGGETAEDVNRIDQNVGAGIALRFQQDAVGSFNIVNNLIHRTAIFPTSDPAAPVPGPAEPPFNPFVGDAIHVRVEGTTDLENATAVVSNSRIEGNAIGDLFDETLGNEGRGIAVYAAEETTIADWNIANNFIGNNGTAGATGIFNADELPEDALRFTLVDNVTVRNVVIDHNTIENLVTRDDTTTPATITNFGAGDGIEIQARHKVDGLGTQLDLNAPQDAAPGFEISANVIRNNPGNGIHLGVEADARLVVNIRDNVIDANGDQTAADSDGDGVGDFTDPLALGSGIFTEETFVDPTDMREIGGIWERNAITDNVGYGFRLDATVTNRFNAIIPNEFTGLTVDETLGINNNDLLISANLIDSNGLDGIEFNGHGTVTIDTNLITLNGVYARPPATGEDQDGNGIDIQAIMLGVASQTVAPQDAPEPQGASPTLVNIYRNVIRKNVGDGLEIRHANNPSSIHDAPLHPGHFPLTVIARENTIEYNGGRGVDILNQGGDREPQIADNDPDTSAFFENQFSPTDTTIRLVDNKIASNAKEGVYVVNTASLTQEQIGPTPVPADPEDPTRGLNNDGLIEAVPRLALELHNNLIIKNGAELDTDDQGNAIPTLSGAGLVMRVGTSDADSITAVESDYASGDPEILNDPPFEPNLDPFVFFNRRQPGGVIAKITENTFEGNFGADVYIESFTSSGAGAVRPTLARLDMIFRDNVGDSLDVTNFGAFFGTPRQNAQRTSVLVPLPGGLTEIFGRVVGVHTTTVVGGPITDNSGTVPIPNAIPTASAFDGDDGADATVSPLDDRSNIYNGNELVFLNGPNADESRDVLTYSGLGLNRFTVDTDLPSAPDLGNVFGVQLSQETVFDVVLLEGDPRNDPNAQPLANNLATGDLAGLGLTIRFIDETDFNGDGTDDALDDQMQPARDQSTTIQNNFQLVNGQTSDANNPNKFHVDQTTGAFVDNVSSVPGTGRGPVASDAGGKLDGTTSNQTLVVAPALNDAPRDENLFVITAVQAGAGDPTFRVAGAAVADGPGATAGVETNLFSNANLGFTDKVSLESGLPLGDELPLEWGLLPDANEQRILGFFTPLTPLPPAPPRWFD